MDNNFLLAVITLPDVFSGEADVLSALFEAGLMKLHIRKPGAEEGAMHALLQRLSGRWASRLVLHGLPSMAVAYGIPQVHGSVAFANGSGRSGGGPVIAANAGDGMAGAAKGGGDAVGGMAAAAKGGKRPMMSVGGLAVSTSVHSWEELGLLPDGLAYSFISPVFDSISKTGYGANATLLRRPPGDLPCMPVGLGGIGGDTLPTLLRLGWKGAAVLGWIWEEPGKALVKFEQLQKLVDGTE